MYSIFRLLALTGTAITLAGSAFAADLDRPVFLDQAPEYQPVEIGTGWYIRGDLGVNLSAKHEQNSYSLGDVRYESDFADAINGGIGAGYQFTEYLRADATVERMFGSDFSATTLIAPRGPCLGYGMVVDPVLGEVIRDPYNIDNCLDSDSAEYKAINMMATAYVDLGTVAGFTPYVGAGVGLSRVTWREETDSTTCIPTAADAHFEGCNAFGTNNQPEPNTTYTEEGTINTGTDYRLAYALTAGVGYKTSPNLTWDLSYRYFSVGGKDTIIYNSTPGSQMVKDGFGSHQVRLGMRYALW